MQIEHFALLPAQKFTGTEIAQPLKYFVQILMSLSFLVSLPTMRQLRAFSYTESTGDWRAEVRQKKEVDARQIRGLSGSWAAAN